MGSDIQSRLKALKPSSPARSLTPLLPLIFQKIDEGVTLNDIYDVLLDEGFSINKNTFRSFIQRHKKKRMRPINHIAKEDASGTEDNKSTQDNAKTEYTNSSNRMSLSEALDPKVREELGSKYLKRRRKPQDGQQ